MGLHPYDKQFSSSPPHGCWGFGPRALCLYNRRLTGWSILPASSQQQKNQRPREGVLFDQDPFSICLTVGGDNLSGWLFPPHQTAAALLFCRAVLFVHGDKFMGIRNAKWKMTLGSQRVYPFLPVTSTYCMVLNAILFQMTVSQKGSGKGSTFSFWQSSSEGHYCILWESVRQIRKLVLGLKAE